MIVPVLAALGLSALGAPTRALELPYRQPAPVVAERDHDSPPYSDFVRVPRVESRMPERPLSHPIQTLEGLNRGGSDIFRERGALPYLAIGVLALATDKKTEKWFNPAAVGEPKPKFAKTFNNFGDGKVILPAMALLYFAGHKDEKDTSKLWAAAVVNATFWAEALKAVSGKERPDKSPDAIVYHGPGSLKNDSWPSGHMTVATASAVILGHQYPRMKIPLYALAACVGVARIQGRSHWPSDVYWGAGAGYYGAWQAIRHKDDILTWRF